VDGDTPLLRVMGLHALAYCERLFYLEEVEEVRVADAAVYAGRTLHEELAVPDPTVTERRNFQLSSAALGLRGVRGPGRRTSTSAGGLLTDRAVLPPGRRMSCKLPPTRCCSRRSSASRYRRRGFATMPTT
jgi:hypothetical protein